MNVSIVIATAGTHEWADLAWSRAYPSASAQSYRGEIVIEHHPELSVAEARNAAARNAVGEWLCFLDADDELEPGYLDAMERRNGGTIYPTVNPPFTTAPPPLLVPALRRVWPDCRESGPEIPNRGRWPRLNECVIGTLIDHRLFDDLGGFRDLPSLEDYDLFLRAYDVGAPLVYVEEAVYRECVNPDGRNRDQSVYADIWAEHETRTRETV